MNATRSTIALAAVLLVSGCDWGSGAGAGTTGPTTTTTGPTTTEATEEVREVPHRVLADGLDTGEAWTPHRVTTSEELDTLVPQAEVDWENEVVFAFTLAESSSCPFDGIAGLEYSEPKLLLYPVVPLIGQPEACTADANPHTIVVAVARDDLPDGEFSIWVDGDDPPAGVRDRVARFAAGELTENND